MSERRRRPGCANRMLAESVTRSVPKRRRTRSTITAELQRDHRQRRRRHLGQHDVARADRQRLEQRQMQHVVAQIVSDDTPAEHDQQPRERRRRRGDHEREVARAARQRRAERDRHPAGPMSRRSCAVRRRHRMFFQKIAIAGWPTASRPKRRLGGARRTSARRASGATRIASMRRARSSDASSAASSNAASLRSTQNT